MALAVGAPVVSWTGPMISGRTAQSCYERMGVMDLGLIAKDWDDYVKIAVRVANDKQLRETARKRIIETCDVLFANEKVIDEMAEWIEEKVKKSLVFSH